MTATPAENERTRAAAEVGEKTPERTSDQPGDLSGGEEHNYGKVPATR